LHIGVCRLTLHLPDSHSLKDKRQVTRSLTSRIHHQFNVTVAEDPGDGLWQSLTLVMCCVSNEAGHANEVISKVVSFVEDLRRDLLVQDCETEIISGV
jgi:uncharacterized protein YlxP (DUF503 family)